MFLSSHVCDVCMSSSDMFRPYAQINDEKTVGFKIEPDNDVFSGDVGFRHT